MEIESKIGPGQALESGFRRGRVGSSKRGLIIAENRPKSQGKRYHTAHRHVQELALILVQNATTNAPPEAPLQHCRRYCQAGEESRHEDVLNQYSAQPEVRLHTMPETTIRVAMIGCGGNARGHMSRLLQIPGVEIVGLCDTAETAIEASRNLDPSIAKAPVFSDYEELLSSVACDAVEISTPHTCHFDQIMAALGAGKHVLCEKPMVCQVDHAHQVIEKISETGLTFAVSYQRHTMAPYRFCRQLIASGEVGKLTFITALQSQNWYTGRMKTGDWRGKKALSGGGQLNDSGSHLIDIVLWMSGLQPAEVFAFQDNLEAEVDIMSALSVKFDGGALLNLSVVGHAVNWFEEITLWTDETCLAIRDDAVWQFEGQTKHVLSGADLGESSSDPDTNFINSISGLETPQATAEDALKVIQLSEATWRSAEQGAVAKVIR